MSRPKKWRDLLLFMRSAFMCGNKDRSAKSMSADSCFLPIPEVVVYIAVYISSLSCGFYQAYLAGNGICYCVVNSACRELTIFHKINLRRFCERAGGTGRRMAVAESETRRHRLRMGSIQESYDQICLLVDLSRIAHGNCTICSAEGKQSMA